MPAVVLALTLTPPPPLAAQRRPPARPHGPPVAHVPPLPDPTGWGTHVLALARAPDGALWVGTYGQGIYVLRPGRTGWENLRADTTGRSISWDFVHAFAFGPGGAVWYGTVGNGWGLSPDGGQTWRSWQFRELGPKWQYVVPNGIVTRGDTVYVATADGIRWTSNLGATWQEIGDTGTVALPSRYVLAAAPAARGAGLWVATLRGVGVWTGARFLPAHPNPMPVTSRVRSIFVIHARDAVVPAVLGGERCAGALRPRRRQEEARWECMGLFVRGPATGAAVRGMAGCDGVLCAIATSAGALYGARLGLALQMGGTPRSRDVYAVLAPAGREPGDTLFGTACGLWGGGSQSDACLTPGDSAGVRAPGNPLHTWFARPVSDSANPYIDQTYRYGSTMGGNFQQHQGVEFNNPSGTVVKAIGSGTVVHAGPAEQGALTVAIRHDATLTTPQGRFFVFSAYYHNSRLLVTAGTRVTRGQPIALVGHTGRATNDHLHLEVHAAPVDSVRLIVDPAERYPPYTTNPELWIEPLPGTGVVAGQVWNAVGQPVPQARVYGLVKPEPQETPFSFAETYGARAHPDPAYGEHFAVSDVPPGEYVLGVEIDGQRVFRRVRVEAGKVSWVEFRPAAAASPAPGR
jgi:murein DD-endopeptidase MepM/ murein hydrolase activator NlpD